MRANAGCAIRIIVAITTATTATAFASAIAATAIVAIATATASAITATTTTTTTTTASASRCGRGHVANRGSATIAGQRGNVRPFERMHPDQLHVRLLPRVDLGGFGLVTRPR